MAFFYERLKGLTAKGNKWSIEDNLIDSTGPIKTLSITRGNDDLGYIITSKLENASIRYLLTFQSGIKDESDDGSLFQRVNFFYDNTTYGYIKTDNSTSKLLMHIKNKPFRIEVHDSTDNNSRNTFEVSANHFKLESQTTVGFFSSYINAYNDITFDNNPLSFAIYNGSTYKGFCLARTMDGSSIDDIQAYFNIPLNATFFNATSDRRAKTNERKATFSALSIINQLPIYNFRYKIDNTDSIGIMAQDAENIKAGDFELVDNKNATGENGNYMVVRESKLVYIAWKAIQEQSKIIEDQQRQINELTALVNKLLKK